MKKIIVLIILIILNQAEIIAQVGNTPDDAITISFEGNEWHSGESAYSNSGMGDNEPKSPCNHETKYDPNIYFKVIAKSNYMSVTAQLGSADGLARITLWDKNVNGGYDVVDYKCSGSHGASVTASSNSLVNGKEYYISFETYNASRPFGLSISLNPGYDYPEGAINIPHSQNWSSADQFTTGGATARGPVSSCGEQINRWFSFIATDNDISIDLIPSANLRAGKIALWDSEAGEVGNELFCTNGNYADYTTNTIAHLSYNQLNVGQQYFFSISGHHSYKGPFELKVSGGVNTYWTQSEDVIYPLDPNYKVAIGTTSVPSDYIFAINGKAIMEEVKVQLSENWPDFVFYDNYELRTLEEVEQHIKEKGHLPEILSEAEVTESGIKLGEMNAKLLQKIEELTLYLIDQNKELKSQRKEIEKLKQQLENE